MPLHNNDREAVNSYCRKQQFPEARDYLLGRASVYLGLRDGHTRAAYHENLGRIYTSLCELDKADEHFNLAIGATKGNFSARLSYIDSLIKRGSFKLAEKYLTEIVDNEPSVSPTTHKRNLRLNILMGKYFKLSGEFAAAAECLDQCLLYIRPDDSAHRDYAFVKSLLAETSCDKMAGTINYISFLRDSRFNGDYALRNHQARIFLGNRITEESNPYTLSTLHSLMANCYLDVNDYTRANEHAEIAITYNPRNIHAAKIQVLALLAGGQTREARDAYEAAARSLVASPHGATQLAIAFRNARMYEVAMGISSTIIDNPATDPETRRIAHNIQGIAWASRPHPD